MELNLKACKAIGKQLTSKLELLFRFSLILSEEIPVA